MGRISDIQTYIKTISAKLSSQQSQPEAKNTTQKKLPQKSRTTKDTSIHKRQIAQQDTHISQNASVVDYHQVFKGAKDLERQALESINEYQSNTGEVEAIETSVNNLLIVLEHVKGFPETKQILERTTDALQKSLQKEHSSSQLRNALFQSKEEKACKETLTTLEKKVQKTITELPPYPEGEFHIISPNHTRHNSLKYIQGSMQDELEKKTNDSKVCPQFTKDSNRMDLVLTKNGEEYNPVAEAKAQISEEDSQKRTEAIQAQVTNQFIKHFDGKESDRIYLLSTLCNQGGPLALYAHVVTKELKDLLSENEYITALFQQTKDAHCKVMENSDGSIDIEYTYEASGFSLMDPDNPTASIQYHDSHIQIKAQVTLPEQGGVDDLTLSPVVYTIKLKKPTALRL